MSHKLARLSMYILLSSVYPSRNLIPYLKTRCSVQYIQSAKVV